MNYVYNIGHTKTVFAELADGDVAVASYLYSPEHDNWIPFSGSVVKADEAERMMVRIARKAKDKEGWL